jgi:hypothetical protein
MGREMLLWRQQSTKNNVGGLEDANKLLDKLRRHSMKSMWYETSYEASSTYIVIILTHRLST